MGIEVTRKSTTVEVDVAATARANEAILIARASREDASAWEQLMEQYQEPVFRLAYLILGDSAEAEDMAQEAFVRAYLALERFDQTRPFRPWLLRIVANLARNRRRSLGRYWAALQRWIQANPDKVDNQPAPEVQSEAVALWHAVRQLKPSSQEIIYLRYFLDLSEIEMSETLNIAPGTVKSRLHRSMKQLRAIIEKEFPDLYETFG